MKDNCTSLRSAYWHRIHTFYLSCCSWALHTTRKTYVTTLPFSSHTYCSSPSVLQFSPRCPQWEDKRSLRQRVRLTEQDMGKCYYLESSVAMSSDNVVLYLTVSDTHRSDSNNRYVHCYRRSSDESNPSRETGEQFVLQGQFDLLTALCPEWDLESLRYKRDWCRLSCVPATMLE